MDFLEIEELVRRAFAEDCAHDDVTSIACVPADLDANGRIVLKQWGCIAGLKFLPWIFQLHDPRVQVQVLVRDGQICQPGTVLALINGPARSLLSGERVAVNFIQHLSGVATLTAKCVAKAEGTGCQIMDTRKTILGLRSLQKYAVKIGGGTNHRMHLADRVLIKNNHIALGSLEDCIRKAKSRFPLGWVEAEVDTREQLEIAISAGVNAALLDNMSADEVRECVALARRRIFLEASGGITLDNLAAYAATGVDGISIGALTHSAPAVDISMRIA